MVDDAVFSALSNPVRRRILEILTDGPQTAGALAARFDLSRPAVSEHLGVLRRAGLVADDPSGRQRHYHLAAEPLVGVGQWLHPFERYWRDRLGALTDVLQDEDRDDGDGTGAVDERAHGDAPDPGRDHATPDRREHDR